MENTSRMQMIGMALIFGLFMLWAQLNAPSEAQIAEHKRVQDSIRLATNPVLAEVANPNGTINAPQNNPSADFTALPDSVKNLRLAATHGLFATSAAGTEQTYTLENDKMIVVFTNKGGRIKEVELKDYFKILTDSLHQETKGVLKLLEDTKNKFEYFLPMANLPRGGVRTGDLYFDAQLNGNEIVFRAPTSTGGYFEQKYVLSPDNYLLDYTIQLQGLNNVVNGENIQLNWTNYLDKVEKNTGYERIYSSVYYKAADDDVSYCTCTSDDEEDIDGERVQWVAHSNQFFNSALMAKEGSSFKSAFVSTEMLPEEGPDLKKLNSQIQIPIESGGFNMAMYVGPNEFDRLRAIGADFEDVIPFGSSIFGTINRWIIRPLFNFLSQFIGSKGLVILLLTFLIKMVLYPLTYKMVYSQQKQAALKPRMAKMREKLKDDQQAMQMEQMKMYREYGVNPVGACLPMMAQMPIWIALFRFFPAAIEFRQQPFLWATDLSSYDAFYNLPFEIPFYGSHVSLLTLIWAGTTVLYTVYNSKQMDMSAMGGGGQQAQMMMYMQYAMPLMFLFFFNNYASGLTTYMLFSNLMNVGQMVGTKEFIIDKKKIEADLVAYQKKPKKKGGFGQRIEAAMKEQQKALAEKEAGAKRKGKKK